MVLKRPWHPRQTAKQSAPSPDAQRRSQPSMHERSLAPQGLGRRGDAAPPCSSTRSTLPIANRRPSAFSSWTSSISSPESLVPSSLLHHHPIAIDPPRDPLPPPPPPSSPARIAAPQQHLRPLPLHALECCYSRDCRSDQLFFITQERDPGEQCCIRRRSTYPLIDALDRCAARHQWLASPRSSTTAASPAPRQDGGRTSPWWTIE